MLLCDCCKKHNDAEESHNKDNYYSNHYGDERVNVTERHYGFYRIGIIVAILFILILVIGCVPVFVVTDNKKLVLIVVVITLLVVTILTILYLEWQRRNAIKMRSRSIRGEYFTAGK